MRPQVVLQLIELLNRGAIPVISAQGSVGASGDLTPLSYLAAVVQGERSVYSDGVIQPTKEAFLHTTMFTVNTKVFSLICLKV